MTTKTEQPFILVFVPHQMPALVQWYYSEQEFTDAWVNDLLPGICNCRGFSFDEDDRATYSTAMEDAGHDLQYVTRIDTADEAKSYRGKGFRDVEKAAITLGWMTHSDDESEDFEDE